MSISRIPLICALASILPQPVISADSEPSFIESVGETRVLQLNLTTETDAKKLEAVRKELDRELSKSNPRSRRSEIWMALGLIDFVSDELSDSIDLFDKVPMESPLIDSALFYKAQALRKTGEKAGQKNPAKGIDPCQKSREVLRQLQDLPEGPFSELIGKEDEKALLCVTKGLIADDELTEARPHLLTLLNSGSRIEDSEREALDVAFAKILKSEDRMEEARLFIAEELKSHPKFSKLSEVLKGVPPSETASEEPGKGEKSSIPPFKRREPAEENLLYRVGRLLSSNKYEDAMKVIVKIYEDHPGSTAAQKCEAKLRSIVDALSKKKKYPSKLNALAKKLPTDPLFTYAKALWQKDFDDEAYDLLEHFLFETRGHPKSGDVYFILGRIDENRGKWSKARESFKKLVERHSASTFLATSHFKVGWLSYLLKEDKDALEWLEYDRALNSSSYLQARALYWISKIYDRQRKKKEAQEYRDEIRRVAPLSYYAVLADRMPDFEADSRTSQIPSTFWNSYHFSRAKAFLASGQLNVARKILSQIDLDSDPKLSPDVGMLLNASKQYVPSFQIAYSLVGSAPNRTLPDIVARLLFPVEFADIVRQEAAANGIDPILIFSVIKQESAYNESAESRVGAMGLMQLMPASAAEVAQQTSAPPPTVSDLLKSETNVRLGVRYFTGMIDRYSGNAYHAISAYNAGPERTDMWVKQWGNLPAPQFVELIPFEETRNYVKSIARNYAFYSSLLEKKKIDLDDLAHIPRPSSSSTANKREAGSSGE